MLELRVLRFDAEAPAPFEPTSTDVVRRSVPGVFTTAPEVFDGGDVRIRLSNTRPGVRTRSPLARDRRERARRDAEEDRTYDDDWRAARASRDAARVTRTLAQAIERDS
ncbi:MAG: hypothetical protein M5U28_10565 [Sandaracinaceae bacterium]|nr:hypothetical protein [Sandaracinaceae bacterium]